MTSSALAEYQQKRTELAGALDRATPTLQALLPADLPVDRFKRIVLGAITRDPTLLTCYLPSIVMAVTQAAECGLEIGGAAGEAYLVPYYNGKRKRRDCQFVAGYRGFVKLALLSGRVQKVEAELVFKGDDFEWVKGTTPTIRHRPSQEASRVSVDNLTHAYAIAFFTDGGSQFEVMDRAALDRIRDRSKAKEFGPWKTDTLAMYRKTPVRSLYRFLPLTRRAMAVLDHDQDRELSGPMRTLMTTGMTRGDALKARLGTQEPIDVQPLDELDPEDVQEGGSDEAK